MKRLALVCVLLSMASCLKEDELVREYNGFSPVKISDGWSVGSTAQNNVDSSAVDRIYRDVYADEKSWPLRCVLLFRNGELLGESYLKDDIDRSQRRAIWSCTKQVLALAVGVLADRGEIFPTDRLEQFLGPYLASHPDKSNISIDNILTMRTGIAFENDPHSDVFRKKKVSSSVQFVLGLSFQNSPGTYFHYNDGDPQLMSAVITSLTQKPADLIARDEVFSRIGFENYEWRRYTDGLTLGPFGILTTPRELAKIGQLVLDSGMWESTQVISKQWIKDMLSVHSTVPNRPSLRFGYYWWLDPARNYSIMWGHGGQYVILMHDKNAMIVITSLEQLDDDFAYPVESAIALADRFGTAMH